MKLDNIELYNKLKEKNVSYLYHANSLTTSLGFIKNGGLFSRGEMERRNINQTEQDSDYVDRKYNVWDDIFLDTVDLHGYIYSQYSRQNIYGPVLFILKSELLRDCQFNNSWITTDNPTNWYKNGDTKIYFDTIERYINVMNDNRQQKMITIRNINNPIPFNEYLDHIELDNPQRCFNESNISAYQYAYKSLEDAVTTAGLKVNIFEHRCNSNCFCKNNYKAMNKIKFNKYFLYADN
ncbi:hypothetical protein [Anaerosinus massiliensis]|uniref:hypothetical protein n=1 Tax=Massilibacillus massiliensis TaxID=1806837 RepID=UPI000DA62479|nr:hypothetical protein [Massilibacillus massiliensis]